MNEQTAIRLYASGMSIRAVAKAISSNRESVRRALNDAGVIRERLAHHGSPEERVLTKFIAEPAGCWRWTGCVNNMGYGIVSWNGSKMAAHRAVWQAVHGRPCPPDLDACHKCDNPICVNPDHIFFGSRADNMKDAAKKGRLRRGEDSPVSVLTEKHVSQARSLADRGQSIAGYAREHNLPYKALWMAANRKTWRHVP